MKQAGKILPKVLSLLFTVNLSFVATTEFVMHT